MTDAINAKNDVLNDQELDAVSGGVLWIPAAVAVRVTEMAEAVRQLARQGGQNQDPASMFQQIMKQLTQGQ